MEVPPNFSTRPGFGEAVVESEPRFMALGTKQAGAVVPTAIDRTGFRVKPGMTGL